MAVYYRKDRDDWAIDVIDEWGRRRRRFVKSEQAARALEANLRHAIAQARAQIKRAAIPEMKLSDAVQMFLTNLAATPTTRGHNAQRLAALTRVIGDPQIHDVTPALLADYQARRREQVSQATLAYEAQVIYRLFRYLVEHGYITVNPAAGLDRKEPRTSPGKELTYEEERKILLACTPRVRLRLLLGLDAGLRRGEMLSLRRRSTACWLPR